MNNEIILFQLLERVYERCRRAAVTITAIVIITIIIALIITVVVLNARVEHGGAPLKVIALTKAIKKKKKFFD